MPANQDQQFYRQISYTLYMSSFTEGLFGFDTKTIFSKTQLPDSLHHPGDEYKN